MAYVIKCRIKSCGEYLLNRQKIGVNNKTETPESTGTKQEQAQAVNVVEQSEKFENTSK